MNIEKQVARDLIEWYERSGIVYEEVDGEVFAVEFSYEGEPMRRFKVVVALEEV